MVLSFKIQHEGKPTYFLEKILALVDAELGKIHRPKIHSIRKGFRWQKGRAIHMATGVRTKNYQQFNQGIPELSTCTDTQDVCIDTPLKIVRVWQKDHPEASESAADGYWKTLDPDEVEKLAINDGFESAKELFEWFAPMFGGQIVHWTDHRY